MRASLASWRTSLSAALGLAVACGGNSTFDSGSEDGMTGGAGGTRTVTGIDLRCHNPTVLRGIDGVETGFVSCDAGFVHRAERRDCASTLPRTGLVIEAPPGPVHVTCSTDADCSGIPNGYCAVEDVSSQGTRVRCVQGCIRDDDCAANQLCLCGDPVGMCVWAECWSDADCGGLLCTTSSEKTRARRSCRARGSRVRARATNAPRTPTV